ncbi:MAG: class I SAM-dependent methyltransferase [Chloroflexi bacterium]|nr:class I SAM-dependent methyltransferase [Chloroflexota bacterium]
MTLPNRDERVKWVISSTSRDEVLERYDAWAAEYDADLKAYGYRSPAIAAGLVGRYVPKGTGPVLDAGAGTGNIGQILVLLGYRDITALDLPEGMLRVAAQTGAYKETRQMALGDHLDFPDNHFAAMVCLGTFVGGHAPAESFDDLIRIVQPGAHMIFTVRNDVIAKFKGVMDAHEQAGRWQLIESTEPYESVPGSDDPHGTNQLFVYLVK